MKIEFYKHSVGKEEIERVNSVLNSLFLTTGDEVAEFEQRLADYLALPYTVAVTSCTAGMHLALIAAGLKPGEEVVTTPLTFIGTANSILMAGGVPVFPDVEMSTGNIDPTKIEEVITDKTRGIMPVHIYGQMCDMDTITEIAERHGLFVIEDAAHSLEGRWRGKASGYYGDYAAFSFYATKNITSGEGGAISVKGEESYELLKKLRLHGLEKTAVDRYTRPFEQYDVSIFGWKYNMDNIHAALLVEQIKKLPAFRARREAIYNRYREAFSNVEGIELHRIREEAEHAYHLFTILVDEDKRNGIMKELQSRGIALS
ncbi:UDP-4-amino-4,6-dideoxy-N-acetyl-beta-L-altrosamine transaminase, partial [bacterium]